ncbi:cytochrome c family protein [Novosphingobium flavum]|uniref:Cytochrome c family protein n=1 Tax=Novosphingobium flavum TaxID=1778672 RepID=A0A7X1FP12_9SPHN|nr:cytochrome c family protein [Novosphingobium flavum]MBC2664341.1 cytochrome c family protein [Novosphingobium flavum]
MQDRKNTIAGWALFSGIVALGLGTLSAHYFLADKSERPEKMGYEIEGVVSSEGGAAAAEEGIEARLAKGDPAKGEAVFKKCQSCHTVDQGGANGIGPNLFATVGEAIAQGKGGFAFSDDLKAKGGKWDFATLDTWLKNPKAFAAGTKMTFAGLPDGQDRANVILFLNSKGSNLPLPAVPAAPAGGAAAAAPAGIDALLASADVAKGEQSFKKCQSCHTINAGGANGIGPNLNGIAGDKVAEGRGGFAFSDDLKAKGGTWDAAALDAWLKNPKAVAAGTKMTFAGIADDKERANVIAYLNSQGGKLTLPAAAPAAK